MESIWQKTVEMPSFSKLNKDIDVDIAIVGGGISGILCAYLLKKEGYDVAIFEANTIGSGQTGKTTAKITVQHGPIYSRMIENIGLYQTQKYVDAQIEALSYYQKIIKEEKIDCDFKIVDTYLYTNHDPIKLKEEYIAYQNLGLKGHLHQQTELPFEVSLALSLENQAIFHPLKFIGKLAEKLTIYEHTMITSIHQNCLYTDDGKQINANKIIFATHFPFVNFPGLYWLKMFQNRSYEIAIQPKPNINNAYLCIDQDAISIRPYQDVLIIGGFPHQTGAKLKTNPYHQLKKFAKQSFEKHQTVSQWSAQDCISLDGLPYIGVYSLFKKNWYVMSGYRKWGMTNALSGAILIRDLIIGKENPLSDVVNPSRFFPLKPFIKQGATAIQNFSKHLLCTTNTIEDLAFGEGDIVTKDHHKVGAYKDSHGHLHYVSLVCPHLGCELKWNPAEKTWDCPCHGSRFDIDGNLIDNPSKHHIDH